MNTYKEFRKWAKEHKYRLDKDEQGYFVSTHTQTAFDAWEARECLETQNTQHNLKTTQVLSSATSHQQT